MFAMRVTRHVLPVLATAALVLAGCSSEEADTAAGTDAAATASADATTGAVDVSSAEETQNADASVGASAEVTEPSAEPEQSEGSEPTQSAAGDGAQPAPQDADAPVAGPASVVDYAIHLPSGGLDACLSGEGSMTCYFESQQFAQCSGDQPLGFATFAGGTVQTGCNEVGEVSAVPDAEVGQIFGDPDGNFLCEVVGAPGAGLRCTEQASGATALLTSATAGVVN